MKIARKDIIAVLELADRDSRGWVEIKFRRYYLMARRYKNGWKINFCPVS